MGMVQRSRRDKANQRVAATRILEVTCAPAELHDVIQRLFDTWNSAADAQFETSMATKSKFARRISSSLPSSRHYFLLERPNYLMVTFGVPATRVAEKGFNPNDRGWLAQIKETGANCDGTVPIGVTLARWVVNENGFIWNGVRYVQMLDGLVAGLTGRYISEPVNEEDIQSIRRG